MIGILQIVKNGLLLAAVLPISAGLSCIAQSGTNLRIMPLGDSITHGTESSTLNGYRGPLAAALSGQVAALDFVGTQISGSMSDPDNEGHPAYTINDIATLTNVSLANYKPNVVLLDAGINDLGQGYEASAPTRLGSLIDQILTAEPDATVLVATLIVNGDPTLESERKTFNSQLPAIIQARTNASKHVALVDMGALTTADLMGTLHPNDTGYQLMANAWDTAIQQAIANHWIADPISGSASRPTGNIYSGVPGLCLDNYGGSSTTGNKVDAYGCNQTAAQQWNVNYGQIAINNLCLDVVGGGTSTGSLVDVASCTNAASQTWTVQNGTIINPASNLCLAAPVGSLVSGIQLQIETCTGVPNQQWRVPSQGYVLSGMAGKCLDAFGGSTANGTKADSYGCNPTSAQQWSVTNNTLTFDGKCLDAVGRGTANGTLVQLYTCNGGPNQVWVPVSGTLVNPASGRCLTVPGANPANGVQLDLSNCGGSSNQEWTLPAGTPRS